MEGQATKKGNRGGQKLADRGFARPSRTENKVFEHVSHDNPPLRALSLPLSPRKSPNRNTALCRLPSSLLHLATRIQSSSDRNEALSLFPLEFAALGQRELGGESDGSPNQESQCKAGRRDGTELRGAKKSGGTTGAPEERVERKATRLGVGRSCARDKLL